MVEPVYPLKGGVLDGLEAGSWAMPVDYLALVEAVDRFGQSVVVAVADGSIPASARHSAYLMDTYCDPVAMVNQTATMTRPTIVQRLRERIQDEAAWAVLLACQPTICLA